MNTSGVKVYDPLLETTTPVAYEINLDILPCEVILTAPCSAATCIKKQEFLIDENIDKDASGNPTNTSLNLNLTFGYGNFTF